MRISDWSSDVCSSDLTTVNLIGNLVFSLLENPQEFKRLQQHQNSLIKPAIEETLRYRSPAQFVSRIATADVTRSEERRVGQECVSTFRSRFSPFLYTTITTTLL